MPLATCIFREGTGSRKITQRWKRVIGKKRARENGMGIRMRRIDSQEKGERRKGVQDDRRNERREKIGRHEGRGKHKEEKK